MNYIHKSLHNKIKSLKVLSNWTVVKCENETIFKFYEKDIQTELPYFTIIVDDGLGFTVKVYNWFLPEDHVIYKSNKRSVRNITQFFYLKIPIFH